MGKSKHQVFISFEKIQTTPWSVLLTTSRTFINLNGLHLLLYINVSKHQKEVEKSLLLAGAVGRDGVT